MFEELEPWERQFFPNCKTQIPTDDTTAFLKYKSMAWSKYYNKLILAWSQGIEAYPAGIEPETFPVIYKPIFNLYGLGKDVRILNEWKESYYHGGMMWMPLLADQQYSTDFVLEDGKVKWYYTLEPHFEAQNRPFVWEYARMPEKWLTTIIKWIESHLHGFVGIINIENKGEIVFDFHSRLSPQFVDLYGKGWIESVIELYEKGNWNWNKPNQYGISYVYWSNQDGYPIIKTPELDGISLQIMFDQTTKLSQTYNNGSYRLFAVNGKLKEVIDAVRTIESNFPDSIKFSEPKRVLVQE